MATRERLATKSQRDPNSIAELETGLQIEEHGLDDALLQQPDLFYRVSKALALAVSRRDAMKQAVAEEEAKADAQFRNDAAKEKEKLTETEIKNMIRLDKDVQKASTDLHDLNRQVGELTALKEAFQQRSYVLKSLVELYVNNYYISNQDGGGSSTSRLKDHDARRVREVNATRRRGDG